MTKIIEIKVILNNFYFYKKLKQRHYALHNHFKKYDLKDIQDILKCICCWIDWIMGKLELHGEL